MKKITRTFLRTDETMTRYMQIDEERKAKNIVFDPYENPKIKEFTHWAIVNNDFPYDAVATTSHMIFTKRSIPFDWKLLTKEEKEEFEHLKETYLKDNYDVVYENLPKGQTIPGHFHLHLLVLKREEI